MDIYKEPVGNTWRSISIFVTHKHRGGVAKIKQISPTLPYSTPRALCGSIEKNTDSLVKGMIFFDQGGGGRGGGKRSWSKALPPSVHGPLVSACFCLLFVVVCAKNFF